jgi:sterol desaturase/sphingolipid hydroxylase (fatty acid hydroxylase superfamily)
LNVDPGVILSLSLIVIFVVIFACAVYVEKAITPRTGMMLLAPALASTIGFGLASALRNGWLFGLSALCFAYFALRLVTNADRILKR